MCISPLLFSAKPASIMLRRHFLRVLGLSLLGPFVGRRSRAEQPSVHLLTTTVAGMVYHAGMDPHVMRGIRAGSALELRREPDNPHDADAIAIHTPGGPRIGYVPRRDNTVITRLMDQNVPLSVQVTRYDPKALPWEQLEVELYQVGVV